MSSPNAGQNFEDILLQEFNKRFSPQIMRSLLDDALKYGLAIMQESTPVKSGTLKNSEGYRLTSDFQGELYATAEYASIVNDGSSTRPPQPFFERGSAAASQKILEETGQL